MALRPCLDSAGCPQCGVHRAQKSDLRAHQLARSAGFTPHKTSALSSHQVPVRINPVERKTNRNDNLQSRSGSTVNSDARSRQESPGFHQGLLPRPRDSCCAFPAVLRSSSSIRLYLCLVFCGIDVLHCTLLLPWCRNSTF